jgi:hypothetical protein
MSERCVWVREVAILKADNDAIDSWEPWEAHNTKQEAINAANRELEKRPSWVSSDFHKRTNRIRKYVPEGQS